MLGETFKGFLISRLLIEEAVDIAAEYYLAITVDRASKSPIMICSAKGGVDIEEVAESDPDAIVTQVIDVAYGPWDFEMRDLAERAGLDPKAGRQFVDIAKKLYDVFVSNDASLAEINPLMVLKDGKVIAADAKFDVDDNALFRHEELLGLQGRGRGRPDRGRGPSPGRHLRPPARRHRDHGQRRRHRDGHPRHGDPRGRRAGQLLRHRRRRQRRDGHASASRSS